MSRGRRMFLRGAAGAVLAMPFLPSLARRGMAQAGRRKRFVFMGHIYGRDWNAWYPKNLPPLEWTDGVGHADLSLSAGELSHAFGAAFDPVRSKMSILQGLDALDADNGHTTSQPLTGGGTPASVSFGYSLDAILEESPLFGASDTKVGALRTSAAPQASSLSFSYSSRSVYAQRIPPEWDPRAVYDDFFNASAIAARAPSIAAQQRVTNAAIDEIRRVQGSARLSGNDRARLENYLAQMTSIESRLARPSNCSAPDPGALETNDQAQSAMIDLEVAALSCGLTDIVVHSIPTFSSDTSLGDVEHHRAAHRNGSLSSATEPDVSQHATYDRWVMGKVAEMLTKLDGVDDGDGYTLLDNTFFLFGNAESTGSHTFLDMPVVVAGGQDMLTLGKYIDFRPRVEDTGRIRAGRPYNNLLVTLLQAMGLQPEDYQRFGKIGFGAYSNYSRTLIDHYAPYLTSAALNEPLPFLYRG
jgi:Protein of unknown function (DUF1552)